MKKFTCLVILTLGFYFSFFHAMDQMLENIKNGKVITFETILNHIVIFKHQTVCSLALVNKWSNQQIKKTVCLRKKRLESLLNNNERQTYLVWHIYGGAYAYSSYSADSPSLTINYIYLNNKNEAIHLMGRWDNEPHPLSNEHRIFFNQKGDACYYASGIMEVLGHGKRREIIEYSLSIDNKSKATRCVLGRINKKKEFQTISLAHIAKNSFPDLTQAILNSCHQYELSTPWHTDKIKVFHWNGVTVPPRYFDSKLYLDSKGKPII